MLHRTLGLKSGWSRPSRTALLPFVAMLVVAGLLGSSMSIAALVPGVAVAAPAGCQLAQIAFCDTFDAPSPNGVGTRSGDLDGVVWGVSRSTSDDNPSQKSNFNWNTSTLNRCGVSVPVASPRDVQICNGQLVESVNDGGAVTVLAMYPRQPFDFAGRTGTVVFDVGNDTQGSHMAWPEFILTDQPVPAPHHDAAGLADFARNSFGIQFAAVCNGNVGVQAGGDSWSVNGMFTTANYGYSGQTFQQTACVKKPTAFGQLNHVEVRLGQTHQEVWATDAGGTTLKQIATANITMPLTRGLAWMEDVHYNADKAPGTQANHTFAWDNFGFDGPALARDLGFDVLDANHSGVTGGSLGYLVASGNSLSLQVPNVHDVAKAAAALVEFTWWPHQQDSITVTVNGHAPHTTAWPYGNAPTFKAQTLAIQVPVAELQNGTNTLTFSSTDTSNGGVSVANLDVILAGAGTAGGTSGGGVGTPPTSTPTPSPTPPGIATATPTRTITPANTPTRTPSPAATSTPTPVLSRTPTRTATPLPLATSTPTATRTPQSVNSYVTSAAVAPASVSRGGSVSLTASVTSLKATTEIIDLEIYGPDGKLAFQQVWDNQPLAAGKTRTLSTNWVVPPSAAHGTYVVKIGIFGLGWSGLINWNDSAGTFRVS